MEVVALVYRITTKLHKCKNIHPLSPRSEVGLQFSVGYLVSSSLCAGTVWSKGSSCVWWRLTFFLISPQPRQKLLLFDVSPSSTFCLLSSIFPLFIFFLSLSLPKGSILSRWKWLKCMKMSPHSPQALVETLKARFNSGNTFTFK